MPSHFEASPWARPACWPVGLLSAPLPSRGAGLLLSSLSLANRCLCNGQSTDGRAIGRHAEGASDALASAAQQVAAQLQWPLRAACSPFVAVAPAGCGAGASPRGS